jgi:hypothetical protein
MCGMLAHLVAYVGALALLAIVGGHLWDELLEKTEAYRIFRHPEGGRQDILWAQQRGDPREMLLGLAGIPRKIPIARHRSGRARPPRCWFSCNFFV